MQSLPELPPFATQEQIYAYMRWIYGETDTLELPTVTSEDHPILSEQEVLAQPNSH
jgi:hypothetical protein